MWEGKGGFPLYDNQKSAVKPPKKNDVALFYSVEKFISSAREDTFAGKRWSVFRPFPVIHERGGAGLVDVVVAGVPMQKQVAA